MQFLLLNYLLSARGVPDLLLFAGWIGSLLTSGLIALRTVDRMSAYDLPSAGLSTIASGFVPFFPSSLSSASSAVIAAALSVAAAAVVSAASALFYFLQQPNLP